MDSSDHWSLINPFSDLGKETQNPFLDTRIRIWIFPKKRTLIYTQKLAQRLFLLNYVSTLNSTFILLFRKKKARFPRLMIAYFFSNARQRFLNPSIVVSPLFFSFELPVTHLMVALSIMQPHPAPDNPLIYTEQQRQRRQNSSNVHLKNNCELSERIRSLLTVVSYFMCCELLTP